MLQKSDIVKKIQRNFNGPDVPPLRNPIFKCVISWNNFLNTKIVENRLKMFWSWLMCYLFVHANAISCSLRLLLTHYLQQFYIIGKQASVYEEMKRAEFTSIFWSGTCMANVLPVHYFWYLTKPSVLCPLMFTLTGQVIGKVWKWLKFLDILNWRNFKNNESPKIRVVTNIRQTNSGKEFEVLLFTTYKGRITFVSKTHSTHHSQFRFLSNDTSLLMSTFWLWLI